MLSLYPAFIIEKSVVIIVRVGIFFDGHRVVVVVASKETDGNLAFAFFSADLSGISSAVFLGNVTSNDQFSGVTHFDKFDAISLFQALKKYLKI